MGHTICVADLNECNKTECIRRYLKPNPYSQSYANFALHYIDKDGACEAEMKSETEIVQVE